MKEIGRAIHKDSNIGEYTTIHEVINSLKKDKYIPCNYYIMFNNVVAEIRENTKLPFNTYVLEEEFEVLWGEFKEDKEIYLRDISADLSSDMQFFLDFISKFSFKRYIKDERGEYA